MTLKSWYKVTTPREDLREGKPLDASEFAVHLDQVRDKRAAEVYQNPERFFERTYLTQDLTSMAAEVVRRLTGEKTETSAVFNMSTQFGGGKTHALTLLYHLAKNGSKANSWTGVNKILNRAKVDNVPEAVVAVFVGTEFDSTTGRGGDDGTPLRKTPWGEIAFQLGGEEAFAQVAVHDRTMTAPAGDVIRKMFPKDKPCLILMDELLNYISCNRKRDFSSQLYVFLHNLSETARGEDNVVLVVSIPASELEMTPEDFSDYDRYKKLLDRLGKAVILSTDTDTSEIIRRRLFEFDSKDLTLDGKIKLSKDAQKTCEEYAKWVLDHRQQVPNWFPIDSAREVFEAAYPFHPLVLSVFERKWQSLPRFQRTRGILRLLALWVSRAYQDGYRGAHQDHLISLGTAPIDDPIFRTAMLVQLGEEDRLEGAITTDICGKDDSHSSRLDKEAVDAIKKQRLHQKVATTIFFESNGGQTSGTEATEPEIRLGVAEPDLDIGNVKTVLDALEISCYYLNVERTGYKFGVHPNLNKIFSDRKANVPQPKIDERALTEISKVFSKHSSVEIIRFPNKSSDIPDSAALTLIVVSPDHSMQDKEGTLAFIDMMTREHGTSARTFKSGLIWAVADNHRQLKDEARNVLAWEDIKEEEKDLQLDENQKKQLPKSLRKAQHDLREAIWRSYKYIVLLGKEETDIIDLGLIHSSATSSIVDLIITRLKRDDLVVIEPSSNFVIRNWPPAFKEWSTKAVRDAFFASPQFPRLLNPESVKETIAKGVSGGSLAYVGKIGDKYEPFHYKEGISAGEVEISEDMFIVTAETAEKYISRTETPSVLTSIEVSPRDKQIKPGKTLQFMARGFDQNGQEMGIDDVVWKTDGGIIDNGGFFTAGKEKGSFTVTATVKEFVESVTVIIVKEPIDEGPTPTNLKFSWTGEIPPQKWMNFYTKVLTPFAVGMGLKLTLKLEVSDEEGLSEPKIEDVKVALRELGLNDDVEVE